MKRYGHLFERIVTFDNLLKAAKKALRGKRDRAAVAQFYFSLEPELLLLEQELLTGAYVPRPYRSFMVYEPKPRRICAADIRDRVVHHAICSVLDPVFEAFSVYDSYACRKDKGTHRAIRRAQSFARKTGYFLKLDVEKFFDSVDHQCLKHLLKRKFKDGKLLGLLERIIDHPIPDGVPGKGLPIGNLTSQHFANFYLGYLDHYAKDEMGIGFYIRYMDDVLVFADDKESLHMHLASIRHFLGERLLLTLKDRSTMVAPVTQGIPFLGLQVFRGTLRLQRGARTRFRRKLKRRERDYVEGRIDERALLQSVHSLVGHVRQADTYGLRKSFLDSTAIMG
ncbi:MAG: reverse transcriptase/maturase family protein [Candidatus Latescibacteria bacterium]|jgi:retron-type reverse transcriptase|nr:reverse transcriptase/maturase family protein [Candidatus Latescibacterota bacterium]